MTRARDLASMLHSDGSLNITTSVNLGDNEKAYFGDANDLVIFHNASKSIIEDVGTGNLEVRGTNIEFLDGTGSEYYLTMANNGSVGLYWDGNLKLSTTSTGVDVSGEVTATGYFRIPNNQQGGFFDVAGNNGITLVGSTGSPASTIIAYAGGLERLRIDSSGNVGIGTTSAGSKLDVTNSTASVYTVANTLTGDTTARLANFNTTLNTCSSLLFVSSAGGGSGLATISGVGVASGSMDLTFATRNAGGNVTERMRIDSTGNVGIGETVPVTPLTIATTNKLGSTFTGTTNGEGLTVTQTDYTSGNYISLVEAAYDDSSDGSPNVRIGAMFDGNGSNLAFGTSNNYGSGITNTAMFINSSGNVGIGGNIDNHGGYARCLQITGAGESAIELENSTGYSFIAQNGANLQLKTVANGAQIFYTNNTERLRIAAAGGIEIPNQNAINELSFTGGDFTNVFSNTTGGFQLGTTGAGYLAFLANNAERMRIKADGTFNYNGLKIFAQSFYGSNNISYSFDIPVGDEGGGGQNMLVLATHAHYYNFSYGCGYYAILGRRQANPGFQARILDTWSNANGGAWSISNPSNSTMRLTKTAGTYGGGGWGIVYVIYPHGT